MSTGDPDYWLRLQQQLRQTQQQLSSWRHVECDPEDGTPMPVEHNLLSGGLQGGEALIWQQHGLYGEPLDLDVANVSYITHTQAAITINDLLEKLKDLQERIEILETQITFNNIKNNEP
jgi:hypothetical protein